MAGPQTSLPRKGKTLLLQFKFRHSNFSKWYKLKISPVASKERICDSFEIEWTNISTGVVLHHQMNACEWMWFIVSKNSIDFQCSNNLQPGYQKVYCRRKWWSFCYFSIHMTCALPQSFWKSRYVYLVPFLTEVKWAVSPGWEHVFQDSSTAEQQLREVHGLALDTEVFGPASIRIYIYKESLKKRTRNLSISKILHQSEQKRLDTKEAFILVKITSNKFVPRCRFSNNNIHNYKSQQQNQQQKETAKSEQPKYPLDMKQQRLQSNYEEHEITCVK